MFSVAVALLRSMSYNLVRNVWCMRCFTDHRIPTWLPMLPRGLRVVARPAGKEPEKCPVAGEWTFARAASQEQPAPPWIRPPARVCLYFHGGAFALCTPATHRGLLMRLVAATSEAAESWAVFAIDYRRPPEHPHPAPLDDCVASYAWLLAHMGGHEASSRIVFAGDSAGGALVVSTLDALRKVDLPMPAGGLMLSPWVDLTDTSSSSWRQNVACDFLPPDLAHYLAKCYAFGNDACSERISTSEDPCISTISQDEDVLMRLQQLSATNCKLEGLPPLRILCGERECLRDQVLAFKAKAEAAGVEVDCSVEPGMVHVFAVLADVAKSASVEQWFVTMSTFLQRVTRRAQKENEGMSLAAPGHHV